MQLIVALIAAAAGVWFLKTSWCPVIRQAIRQLPDGGQIRRQQLTWNSASPVLLAENRFLAIGVDLDGSSPGRSVADLRVQFQKDQIKICSLLGCVALQFPEGWVVAFDRTSLEPWWGAREFAILAAAGAASVIWLMLSWAALATAYFVLVYVIGYVSDRDVTWSRSWRVAAAALMPGALGLTVGIVLYGLQALSLVGLLIVFLLHFVIGWSYVGLTPFFLRRASAVPPPGQNPFAAPGETPDRKNDQ